MKGDPPASTSSRGEVLRAAALTAAAPASPTITDVPAASRAVPAGVDTVTRAQCAHAQDVTDVSNACDTNATNLKAAIDALIARVADLESKLRSAGVLT